MGFIGGHLALKLLSEGHEVHVVDNLVTSSFLPNDLKFKYSANYYFHQLNLADKNANNLRQFRDVLADSDYCFHFANPVGVAHIDKNPHQAIINMNTINQLMLELLVEYKIKTIFASSSEVYGNRVNASEDDELTIGSPKQLRWGYACGKLMMEFLLKSYQVPHITLRFFNVTGVGQSYSYGMVLPSFIDCAKNGKELVVYGDGGQLRTFCDIDDVLNAVSLLIERNNFDGSIYNIGNEENVISIKELAEKVIRFSGSSSKIVFKDFASVFSAETGEIHRRIPNTKKMQKFYVPNVDIDTCIKKMLSSK